MHSTPQVLAAGVALSLAGCIGDTDSPDRSGASAVPLEGHGAASTPETSSVSALQTQPTTYTNPSTTAMNRDPFVVKAGDGNYYAYVSGFDFYARFPVMAYSSPDLVNWTQLGTVLDPADAGPWVDASSGWNFSSPSVVHVPDNPPASRYVLYFTALHAGSGDKCVGAAAAADPAGPFVGQADPLICPPGGAQDASPILVPEGSLPFRQLVYRDNSDGALYNRVLELDGQSVSSDLDPYKLYDPADSWWHDGVVERPAVTWDDGQLYLFFSGGERDTVDRATGWSRCRSYLGVTIACDRQTSFGTWLASTDDVHAPSAVQVFRDGDHQWITYDARPGGSCDEQGCTGTATMRLDKLCFTDRGMGQPRTNGPSVTAQDLARQSDCSDDVPGAPFAVDLGSFVDETPLDQPATVPYRDGGATIPVGGRTLWTFSDGFGLQGCSATSNSGGFGAPADGASGPGWMEHGLDDNGCVQQLIPYTTAELDFNADPDHPDKLYPGDRMALWEGGGVALPDGDAMVFFLKLIDHPYHPDDKDKPEEERRSCNLCYTFLGSGVARVPKAHVAAGTPVVDRSPSVSPSACNPDCLVEATDVSNLRRPFVDGDYVYAWGSGPYLGRALIDDLEDRAAWEFWSEEPAPATWVSDLDDADPVPGLTREGGLDHRYVGQVDYNGYLDKYVNTVSKNWPETDVLVVQVADEPWGPWSQAVEAYQPVEHTCLNNEGNPMRPYGLLANPEYWMNGGRTISYTYARPGPSFGTNPACPGQVRYVTFELE